MCRTDVTSQRHNKSRTVDRFPGGKRRMCIQPYSCKDRKEQKGDMEYLILPTTTHLPHIQWIQKSATCLPEHAEALNYFLFQRLNWIRSMLTMAVIFCWIKASFKVTPTLLCLVTPEIETPYLRLFCKTTKDFIVFLWQSVSEGLHCNFVSCIQSISFVHLRSFSRGC